MGANFFKAEFLEILEISEKAAICTAILLKAISGRCTHTKTAFASRYLKKVFDFEFDDKTRISKFFESEIFFEQEEGALAAESAEALVWRAARRAGMDATGAAASEVALELDDADALDVVAEAEETEPEAWHPWDDLGEGDLEACCSWLQRQSECRDRSGVRRAVRLALEAGVAAQAEAAKCAATLRASGLLRSVSRTALLHTALRQRCARGGVAEAEALDALRAGVAEPADTALAILAAAGTPLDRLQALRERALHGGAAGERDLVEAVLAAGRAARSRRARDSRQGRLL